MAADRTPIAPSVTAPLAARLGVTAAEIFCVVGTLVGVGVLGTRVEESSGGALAADATLLAPAGPAFSIWSVIYLGLFAYTVWQWLPSAAGSPYAAVTRGPAAISMVLNAAWLLVTQQGWLWASVAVIVALTAVLAVLLLRVTALRRSGQPLPEPVWAARLVLDGTFGLYLGWVAVATCANITATLVASGVDPGDATGAVAAVAVLIVVAVIGVALARRPANPWVAAAMAWGLAWIAVGRLTDAPASAATAVAAAGAAAVIVAAHLRSLRTLS